MLKYSQPDAFLCHQPRLVVVGRVVLARGRQKQGQEGIWDEVCESELVQGGRAYMYKVKFATTL